MNDDVQMNSLVTSHESPATNLKGGIPLDAVKCLISRRSIREYMDTPLKKSQVENVVSMAQMASSWENGQPVRYVAVMDKEIKHRLAMECTGGFPWNQEYIDDAPALIVLCVVKGISGYEPDGSPSTEKGSHWQSFDAGVAAAHFCLAARAMKLGTLIMGRYDEKKVKQILSLPEEYDVACLIAMGYPAVIPAAAERKTIDEILTFK